jgi:8-oxo-dGTP pyrophosphatase MutT (NUDIX family)
MHRNNLLDLLYNYHPDNDLEIQYKKDIIDFVLTNENCFERSNVKGHMTASGWLINQNGDKVLLMHHRKLNEWLQFGGHADGETDLLQVAIKETQEESGIIDIKPVMTEIFDIDIHYNEKLNEVPAHIHYDIRFLLQLQKDEKEKKMKNLLHWRGLQKI